MSNFKYRPLIWMFSNATSLKAALSGLRQLLAIATPLKMMKNAFYLHHLKSSFRSQGI